MGLVQSVFEKIKLSCTSNCSLNDDDEKINKINDEEFKKICKIINNRDKYNVIMRWYSPPLDDSTLELSGTPLELRHLNSLELHLNSAEPIPPLEYRLLINTCGISNRFRVFF